MIRQGLTGELRGSVSLLVSSPLGVHRVPVPAEVIVVAVRWYLRYGLSYRDVQELPARCPATRAPAAQKCAGQQGVEDGAC
jgi:hypothetical protein